MSSEDVLEILTKFCEEKVDHLTFVEEKIALLIVRKMLAAQETRFFQVDTAGDVILSITDITDRLNKFNNEH
jgi:hypothetical protein